MENIVTKVFENSEFGSVRTLVEDGVVLFCGMDCAKALGYSNSRQAINDHCKDVVKKDYPTKRGVQSLSFIPKEDLYRLIVRSKLPTAEKFEQWAFNMMKGGTDLENTKIKVFENNEFGDVRILVEDGVILFCGSDCAKALGYSRANDAITVHCLHRVKRRIGVQTGVKADGSDAIQQIQLLFIPEGDLYRLIVRSNLPAAEKFERWVFDDVLPTVREKGSYFARAQDSYMISDPVARAKRWIEEEENRQKLQWTVEEQAKTIEYKEDVIVGLVGDIDLATKRQRIKQIVGRGCACSEQYSARFTLLYSEFEKKYHCNLGVRMESKTYEHLKPKLKDKMDLIERGMNKIPELYEIACKLFENDVKALLCEWQSAISLG